jgi:O-methyltransferase
MIWRGLVYNPDANDSDTQILRDMAKKVHADERVDVSFLTVGDGTMLAIKR